MKKIFKSGNKVYHRNLKLHGTFIDYPCGQNRCWVETCCK